MSDQEILPRHFRSWYTEAPLSFPSQSIILLATQWFYQGLRFPACCTITDGYGFNFEFSQRTAEQFRFWVSRCGFIGIDHRIERKHLVNPAYEFCTCTNPDLRRTLFWPNLRPVIFFRCTKYLIASAVRSFYFLHALHFYRRLNRRLIHPCRNYLSPASVLVFTNWRSSDESLILSGGAMLSEMKASFLHRSLPETMKALS